MGDDKGCAAADDGGNGVLHGLLRHGVHRGGRLVQDQDAGVGQDGAGDRQQLLLAGGEEASALADLAVQAFFHPVYDKLRGGHPQGLEDLFVGRVLPAVAEVVADGSGKEIGGLQDVADAAVEPELGPFPGVPAVDQDLALRRLIETAGQVDQGRLARARLADDRDVGPLRDLQIEVLQDHLISVRIHEGHIPELHLSVQGLPVLFFRMEIVAVLFNDFGRVHHVRDLRDQAREALDVDLDRDQGGQGIDDLLDRAQHAHGVGHEDGQGSDPDDALHGQRAAAPQNQGQGQRRQQRNEGCQHGAVAHGLYRGMLHPVSLRLKAAPHDILDPHGLDAPHARDPFVEISGDPRVDLAHDPVVLDDFFLEIHDSSDGDRHHDQDTQGEADIHDDHHCRGEYDIGDVPHDIHHPPGQEFPDALRVTHGPRVNVAHAVLVEIGEGQGLQVLEDRIAQVVVNQDLDPSALIQAVIVVQLLQHHEQQVEAQEDRQSV